MNIVIDTNVVISGTFFGGFPRRVLEAVVEKKITAFATVEIVDEYNEIVAVVPYRGGAAEKRSCDSEALRSFFDEFLILLRRF